MKLLHTFRPVDPAHNVLVPLPSSRRTMDAGLTHSSQEFHSISDEVVYRKEERWRRGAVDTRSLSGHSYNSQDATRVSSKLPSQRLPTKSLDDYGGYAVDESMEDLPVSTSRFVSSSSPYSSSRGKLQALHGLSSSRTNVGHLVGNLGHSELNPAEASWRDGMESRDHLYRKRHALSPSPDEELKRGGLSSSPSWKAVHPTVELTVDEVYDRHGKGGYKEESSYLSSRRRRHNDIDLNIALEMGQGEPDHLHDVKSKGVRRRVWDEEEERRYSLSPPSHRSLLRGSSSLQLQDHGPAPDVEDDYDEDVLDSRHMVSSSRTDYPHLRTEEKGSPMSISFSNGKFGKAHPRAVTMNTYSKDKPVVSPIVHKRPLPGRDSYNKEPTLRGTKAAPGVFKIKANLQTPGRGKPERVVTMFDDRVVTMVDKANTRSQGNEGFGNGGSSSQGRKRKASVWSRISLPGKGPLQNGKQHGRGRVFSRLGPSLNGSFEPRDETYVYKNKKPRQQQTGIDVEDDFERFEDVENSPDALKKGEEYLNDDHDAEGSDKETERGAHDLQGWTRKKASVVNSGDESCNPGNGDYSNAKGRRRKLVRPPIGTKDQVDDGGWKRSAVTGDDVQDTHALPRSHSGSMDMDTTNIDAQAATNKARRGPHHDLNSLAEDYRPDSR